MASNMKYSCVGSTVYLFPYPHILRHRAGQDLTMRLVNLTTVHRPVPICASSPHHMTIN